jgi:hypothetical protein
MAHHCYRVHTIVCPNCQPCDQHEHSVPRIAVGKRYYHVADDGTETELTAEQYADRMKGTHP